MTRTDRPRKSKKIMMFLVGKVKLLWNFAKDKIDKNTVVRKVTQITLIALIVAFVMLGIKFKCNYHKGGLWCSVGYTPPDADDVRKVLPLSESMDKDGAIKSMKGKTGRDAKKEVKK